MTTRKQVLDDLSRFAEKCPERRIVCIDYNETPTFINCVEYDDEDDPWKFTLVDDEDVKRKMTVASLLESLSEVDEDDPDPEGEDSEMLVRIYDEDEDEYCTMYLDDSNGDIFFEHSVDGEAVIAFYTGDEADSDDDFMDDDD